jgi:hypothetical protein
MTINKIRFPFLFSRNKTYKRKPIHFKFDSNDIKLSNQTPQTEYNLPHWKKFPKCSIRVITGKELLIQYQIKKITKRWKHIL